MASKYFRSFLIVSLIMALTMTGCGKKDKGAGHGGMMGGFAVGVVAFHARTEPIAEQIALVGSMAANESVEIKSEIDGTVEVINFEEGQTIKKGTVLFQINKNKLEATLAQAKANLDLAKATSERYKSLIETGAVAQQEYDQATATLETTQATLELTEQELAEATITAPFDGVMGQRLVSIGQYVATGASLSFLINEDPMKAEFHIPERYLSRINLNQKVEIKVSAYPDESFEGEVYFIDPQINELTRTALVKAYVSNKEGKLRRGMFAKLDLIFNVRQNALIIPETAIITKGDQTSVFAIKADETVEIRVVEIGIRRNGMVEILSGVQAGEAVVIEGYQKLGPGAKVKATIKDDYKPNLSNNVTVSELLQKYPS